MTLAEFKAWFEGYTESITSNPSEKQWARIKERVAQVDGAVTTYPVFVDRYWRYPPPIPYWSYPLNVNGVGVGISAAEGPRYGGALADSTLFNGAPVQVSFTSVGQADAALDAQLSS